MRRRSPRMALGLALASCSYGAGGEGERPAVAHASSAAIDGLVPGWRATEVVALRSDPWRFYRLLLEDPEASSVREDNAVLRDGVRLDGEAGLGRYLVELGVSTRPDAVAAARLAEQIGMFMIRGDSRRETSFKVLVDPDAGDPGHAWARDRLHPPEARVVDGRFIHRAWLAHGGPLWHYVTTLEPDGRLSVDRSERIDRR